MLRRGCCLGLRRIFITSHRVRGRIGVGIRNDSIRYVLKVYIFAANADSSLKYKALLLGLSEVANGRGRTSIVTDVTMPSPPNETRANCAATSIYRRKTLSILVIETVSSHNMNADTVRQKSVFNCSTVNTTAVIRRS